MIIVIDNRDSFVFNLARCVEALGAHVSVVDGQTNDLAKLERLEPSALILSPGPCTPREATLSVAAVRRFAGQCPILGVCLGHQVIADVYGWTIARSTAPTHGQSAPIRHTGGGLFANLPNPVEMGLYHSLIARPEAGTPLIEDAWSPSGEVMALHHAALPIFGVQFHPESILSAEGQSLLKKFLQLTEHVSA